MHLADEGIIVLGKVVEGALAADLKVGMAMELTTMPLYTGDDGVTPLRLRVEDRVVSDLVYILGAGMHPWGKWGRDFTEYRRVVAARSALKDAGNGLAADPTRRLRRHHPQRVPRFRRRGDLRPETGLDRNPGVLGVTPFCAWGSQALQSARARRFWPDCATWPW